MTRSTDVALLAGRLLFGGFFVYSARDHFFQTSTYAGFAAGAGVPFATLAVLGTGVLLLVGGLSILLGLAPRFGLACIILFLVGVTPLMHAFWILDDPQMRLAQLANFMRNVAFLGSCLAMLTIPTPWPLSVGGWRERAMSAAARRTT